MSRFNLLDEKWIPVRFPNGSRDELGIRDVLLRSREIAVIEDPSPLVVAALHRFLLAVLYRALEGPTDIEQAKALFQDGLPGDRINAYLGKWRDRFWLFDEKYPFYQVPDYEPKEEKGQKQWKPWTVLAAEHNGDNSKVLFDHVDNTDSGTTSSRKAARWLIACQTFALGGGKSDFQYTRSGPSATAVMALPLGRTLQDTLVLSLVPENREVLAMDLPTWERGADSIADLKQGVERAARGYVDLYSWPSRSIRLRLQGDGRTLEGLAFASGVVCTSGDMVDPMLGYRINEKRGKLPVRFESRDRGLWRDFDSLLPDEAGLSPRAIAHATRLARTSPERAPRAVMILGQAADKAKVKFWRMERFALPEGLLDDSMTRMEIRQLLAEAEDTSEAIEKCLRKVARLMLAKGGRDVQPDKRKAGKWAPGDESKFVGKSEFGDTPRALTEYWSFLESCFHHILGDFTLGRDTDAIRLQWLQSVRAATRAAWESYQTTVGRGGAWGIRALVRAEEPVERRLKELSAEIDGLTSQMEVA